MNLPFKGLLIYRGIHLFSTSPLKSCVWQQRFCLATFAETFLMCSMVCFAPFDPRRTQMPLYKGEFQRAAKWKPIREAQSSCWRWGVGTSETKISKKKWFDTSEELYRLRLRSTPKNSPTFTKYEPLATMKPKLLVKQHL